jgi:hypothetical protein
VSKQKIIDDRRTRFIVATKRSAFESLANEQNFLLHLGWVLQRCGLTDAFYENNGSELFKFEGRRQIAVEILSEMKEYVPDIYERVLGARKNYEVDLNHITLTPEEMIRAEDDDG